MQERRLEVFLAVAMSRTFGKAADMLNVTPSSVSRELKMLEEEVGMLLVDRQKGVKSVKLTPAGESFLPLVLRWQEVKRELTSSCGAQQAFFLSIAGCETANNNLLPEVFIQMINHDPPVHLRIITDPTDKLYEKVETREVDAAFVVHQESSRFVKITPIYSDPLMVMRLEDNYDDSPDGGIINPTELSCKDELYIEWSNEFRIWHNSIWDPSIPVPVELSTTYLLPNMMNRPGQWAVLPKCAAEKLAVNRPYKIYRLGDNPPDIVFYKLTHRNPKISALRGLEILEEVLVENNLHDLGEIR